MSRTWNADFVALAKPRLNMLVVVSTVAGYVMGGGDTHDISRLAAVAIGTGLVAGMLFEVGRSPVNGRVRDSSHPTDVTPLGLLQSRPLPYLGQQVRCVFQVQSVPESWNPYVTRFGTRDYRALSVWTDEQLLWDREQFDKPFGLVFVRRGGDAEELLAQAKPYQRYEVTAVVAQVFLGRPWLAITSARRLGQEVGEGTVIHAARAIALFTQEHYKLALEDLQRALAPENLPQNALEELQHFVAWHLLLGRQRRVRVTVEVEVRGAELDARPPDRRLLSAGPARAFDSSLSVRVCGYVLGA